MTAEMLKLYKQLEKMKASKDTAILKDQIKESLYQQLRLSFLDFLNIGRVIGYDQLKNEMLKAVELIEQQEKMEKNKKK